MEHQPQKQFMKSANIYPNCAWNTYQHMIAVSFATLQTNFMPSSWGWWPAFLGMPQDDLCLYSTHIYLPWYLPSETRWRIKNSACQPSMGSLQKPCNSLYSGWSARQASHLSILWRIKRRGSAGCSPVPPSRVLTTYKSTF